MQHHSHSEGTVPESSQGPGHISCSGVVMEGWVYMCENGGGFDISLAALSLLSHQLCSALTAVSHSGLTLSKLTVVFLQCRCLWSRVPLFMQGNIFSSILWLTVSLFVFIQHLLFILAPTPFSNRCISVSAWGREKKCGRQEIHSGERQVRVNKEEVYSTLPERHGCRKTREGLFFFFLFP